MQVSRGSKVGVAVFLWPDIRSDLGLSNTKVGLFQQYATVLQPFRTVINTTPIPNAFSKLAKLDQEKTCHLHHAADMIQALTNGLGKFEQVHKYQGMVTAANLSEKVTVFK